MGTILHVGGGGRGLEKPEISDGQLLSFLRICRERFSLISLCRGTGWAMPGLGPFVSRRKAELSNARDAWYAAAREIEVEIFQVLLKILLSVTLPQVVRVFVKISEPVDAILPIDISRGRRFLIVASADRLGWWIPEGVINNPRGVLSARGPRRPGRRGLWIRKRPCELASQGFSGDRKGRLR